MRSHTKEATKRDKLARHYWNKGREAANDPTLIRAKRDKKAKKYQEMGDGEAAKCRDQTEEAEKYQALLRAGKGGGANRGTS